MPATPWTPNRYPQARRSDHVDVYKSEKHGEVRVPNPYRWLEEHSEETERWINAQAEFTKEYLSKNPDREVLEQEIRANTDYARFTAPSLKRDGRWYWSYNSGLQAQNVIYRTKDDKLPDCASQAPEDIGEVFFDPNLLSEDGTVALTTTSFSHCGKYCAYGISISGSDFFTVYVRSTDEPLSSSSASTDHHDSRLKEEIRFVKFSSIAWTHDSKGFFYQRFPDRESHGLATEDKAGTETTDDKNAMLYYHRIGTPQSDDILVLKNPDEPEWRWGAYISELDGRYLYVSIGWTTARKNLLWIADLQSEEIGPNMKWKKVINDYEAEYDVFANDGTKQYLRTNANAPMYKAITIDLADDKYEQKDLIPEEKDAFLDDIGVHGNDTIVTVYKRNVIDEIYISSIDGKNRERLASDFVGAISVNGRRDMRQFFLTLTGFTNPGIVAKYDLDETSSEKRWSIFRTTVLKGLKPNEFIAEQIWYDGKDGTKVPMFVVRHTSTKLDGTAAAIQYGYGGFSISINPSFSASILSFIKRYNAIFALPNIRGGGEFGEDWHEAGIREKKLNVFNDFIAATEYLTKEKYVAPGKVAINGGSNGGLLIGACANIAPEGTFGAAVAEVGVMDMLKFADFTIGRAWVSDYGDPHDPHDFDFIYPYSPVHNVPTNKNLPPLLLMTADHDDRVVPLHSFKHAATLQHTLPNNPHPLLIRVDVKAGHGAGKATEKRIQDAADKWGFVAQSLGLELRKDT
ncbi:hypothetical protein CONPUDRAFT_60260 [Coniophora puteana RWD-64-598 SS2]|uniref:Prolyl endopeptidase n=1 Tax=Coniophora puteana (strain RWD-64-598) TaxID=741705 RepID=A0A5M3ML74_CONPW|nr:uncharacterized protein CONPUDRAFT_60260 [Coniophora puteana RWD-64-598 SS2]EIW79415.1 hypothetical protein CONPUDRAFT_60260 [Coniophora puteana RWD-64-598 SS2]